MFRKLPKLPKLTGLLLAAPAFMLAALAADATQSNARVFGKDHPFQPEELPESKFKNDLLALPAMARLNALRNLNGLNVPARDFASLHVGKNGDIHYGCGLNHAAQTPVKASAVQASSKAGAPQAGAPKNDKPQFASIPIATPPIYHSRRGAPNSIVLDFNGMTIQSTQWNTDYGVGVFQAQPFSLDADYTTFSDIEQQYIKQAWQRVAEDFAPFNVDVTTEEPAVYTSTTAHVLITEIQDKNGILLPATDTVAASYTNVFGLSNYATTYSPSFVFSNTDPDRIAGAASHNVGHNLGLSHDGTTAFGNNSAYTGHGAGLVSWVSIMGSPFGQQVSQWSKGDYFDSNNAEDDLAIISSKLNYRADDVGNTVPTASLLVVDASGVISATTPESDPDNLNRFNKGVIERNTDVDVFRFNCGDGPVSITVKPYISTNDTLGCNLDVRVELRDAGNTVIQTANPAGDETATIATNLTAGNYFLFISGTGEGNPLLNPPTGYVKYGSLGQYFVTGTVVPGSGGGPGGTGSDLAIQGLNTPAVIYAGQVAPVTVTVANNGQVDSGSGFVSLFPDRTLAVVNSLTAADVQDMPQVNKNTTVNVILNIVFPESGEYDLAALVDSQNNNIETNELNNIFSKRVVVYSSTIDLAAASVTVSQDDILHSRGITAQFNLKVANRGLFPAGAFTVGFYPSRLTPPGPNDTPLSVQSVASLQPGELQAVSLLFELPVQDHARGGRAWFLIDPPGTFVESSKNNNTTSATWGVPNDPPAVGSGIVLLTPYPLTTAVSTFSVTASDPTNDPIFITWDFGDGSVESGSATYSHTYKTPGRYTVRATVADGPFTSQTLVLEISVGDGTATQIFEGPLGLGQSFNAKVPLPAEFNKRDRIRQHVISGNVGPKARFVNGRLRGVGRTPGTYTFTVEYYAPKRLLLKRVTYTYTVNAN